MAMHESDLIVAVRGIRNLVVVLDSIGFPIQELLKDNEFKEIIPSDIVKRISSVSLDVHNMLQKIENSKRYKEVVFKLCNVSERKTFYLEEDEDND